MYDCIYINFSLITNSTEISSKII